jgi:hypothetical protein
MSEPRTETKTITLSLKADVEAAGSRAWVVIAALALASAGAVIFLPLSVTVRSIAVVGLLALGLAPALSRRARGGRKAASKASILLDGKGIWRKTDDGDVACIARWDEPFGVTVLASPSKARALFAFSSAERTRLVAVRVEGAPAADAARRCLDRAVPATDADLDDALGGIGRGLSGKSAAVLFAELEKRAAPSIGRIYLSDASGAKVTLEGDKLRARDKLLDLADPLEWRSFMFHEGGHGLSPVTPTSESAPAASGVTVYHAMWARQGPTELVFVCPIPADASSWGIRSADPPPLRELRVAVDRLFMIPLRKALEGAPRISRAGAPPRKSGSFDIRTDG